jgi:hypothetical protein
VNAWEEILELAGDERIEAICIGDKGWRADPGPIKYFDNYMDAKETLCYEFDDGYGGPEGHVLYAWTKNFVIVPGYYDGSEWYVKVPRNPTREIRPERIGGG